MQVARRRCGPPYETASRDVGSRRSLVGKRGRLLTVAPWRRRCEVSWGFLRLHGAMAAPKQSRAAQLACVLVPLGARARWAEKTRTRAPARGAPGIDGRALVHVWGRGALVALAGPRVRPRLPIRAYDAPGGTRLCRGTTTDQGETVSVVLAGNACHLVFRLQTWYKPRSEMPLVCRTPFCRRGYYASMAMGRM